MKYLIIVTLTLVIQLRNSVLCRSSTQVDGYDYGEPANFNADFEAEDEPKKPIYEVADSQILFGKFIEHFNKKYKDVNDYSKHYGTFVKNLEEINAWNSDPNSDSSIDINMFSDLTAEERAVFTGGIEAKSSYQQKNEEFLNDPETRLLKSLYQPENTRMSSTKQIVKGIYSSPVVKQVKPIYKIEDAPKLFEKFVKDYNKIYKNEIDRLEHYKTFVETLTEINEVNSNNEFSEIVNIDIFADLSHAEKVHLV